MPPASTHLKIFRPGHPYMLSACHLSMQHNHGLTRTVLCLKKIGDCPKLHTILNTSTVTDNLCNSDAFNNPNAVRDCLFNLKEEAWFLSSFFSYATLLFLKLFSAAQQNIFLQNLKRKYYFM